MSQLTLTTQELITDFIIHEVGQGELLNSSSSNTCLRVVVH